MAFELNGKNLHIEQLVKVARHNQEVKVSSKAMARIKSCRDFFESKLKSGKIVYGVNTGVGEFSELLLNETEVNELPYHLIRSHSAGIGKPLPVEFVRGAMLSKVNVHLQGYSACRPEITNTYIEMLNKGVTPVVCSRGSVGACGDLAPMSQIALLLFGEGEAFYQGERLPGKEAMKKAKIPLPGLQARDGLAAINGSNLMTAINAIQLFDINRWLKQAEIACAMAAEALNANLIPFRVKIHAVRGFAGCIRSAKAIGKCIMGSELEQASRLVKVQDAYSLRSAPQVIGAAHDALAYARQQIEIELNGVADNPIFFYEDKEILTGANFQGTPVSLPMEMIGAALTMVCVMSERRLNRLMNSKISEGLPPFLSPHPGSNSGFMISQYTAGALIAEQRILSHPAVTGSIPAAADQEDFVSMGMTTSLKNQQIYENACGVLGIELLAAAQGLEIRGHNYGKGTEVALKTIRSYIPSLIEDRVMHLDQNKMCELIKQGVILDAVENEIGSLG